MTDSTLPKLVPLRVVDSNAETDGDGHWIVSGLPPGEYRVVEETLRAQGLRPFSCWQLLGAGAVGSQSLLGIARLHGLRHRLGDRTQIWPFTTGLATPNLGDGAVVVAEVWPSMHPVVDVDGDVRDAIQVRTTARWLAD